MLRITSTKNVQTHPTNYLRFTKIFRRLSPKQHQTATERVSRNILHKPTYNCIRKQKHRINEPNKTSKLKRVCTSYTKQKKNRIFNDVST